jgi:hypothetical protein
MSFVTTQPEALTAAATKLRGLGSAMAAQNAGAAAPTTGMAPAAADEVSALQATQFSAYGTLYQQVSAQAQAIHEMFVNTLGTSAGSYGATEAANSAAAGSSGSGVPGLLTGNGSFGLGASAISNSGILGALQAGAFGSAASDLLQLGSSGFLAPGALAASEAAGSGGLGAATLTGAAGPAGTAASGAAPVLASVGQGSSVGGLSVPPSWAGEAASTSGPAPATLAGAGWTTPAPQTGPVATMPAGMPSVASAGRGGFGFGAPRYGVKPTVMPKPMLV